MTVRAAALLVLAAACTNDVTVGEPLRRVLDVPPAPLRQLDVLFVVDPTAGAADARAALAAAAGAALFDELQRQLGQLPDLRVGVVSSEVASGGLPAGCDAAGTGVLTACPALVPGHYLTDTPNSDGSRKPNYTGSLGDAVACLADVPSSTCAVSQPIAAVLAALGDHAPSVNGQFVRTGALLLVVFVAPRDDCSAVSPQLFESGGEVTSPLDSRCFAAATRCAGGSCSVRDDGGLIPIADAASRLAALKSDDPTLLFMAGVFAPPGPVTLITHGGGVLPAPACATVAAAPAFRLAALTGEFSSRYAFASMCDADPTAELTRVADAVADVMGARHCLLGPVSEGAACRAFASTSAARAPIPACRDAIGGDCFTIAPSDQCAATDSGLAASPTSAPPGAHFVVECAAPDGL